MPQQIVRPEQLGTGTRDGTKFLRDDGVYSAASSGGSGSGGTGGSIVPIQTQDLTGLSTLAFSIPAGFRNLRLTGRARSSTAATTAALNIQFNGDTGANYDWNSFEWLGSNISSAQGAVAATAAQLAVVSAASATAGAVGQFDCEIIDHSNAVFWKSAVSNSSYRTGTTTATEQGDRYSIWWRNTTAITSITLTLSAGTFATGSVVTLWGEADTAPVLLTSNSNLLFETILTAAAATISIPNIPQGYRDLRIVLVGAGDAAAQTFREVEMQFNGDTAANYQWADLNTASNTANPGGNFSQTYLRIGFVPGATGTANMPGICNVVIGDYARTTFFKPYTSQSYSGGAGAAASSFMTSDSGAWKSTAAITSIRIFPVSGNFVANTVVRVYGEPAAAAGSSVGTGTRLRISGNQSITTATATSINWDTEDNDADNQHYTSVAALTGTVAKTAASATLTGTSTLFTTELSVGQVISVPGTAAEVAVVIAIASNTSLTVAVPFVNTASAQTASRVNSAIAFRQPGFYALETTIYSAAVSTGTVTLQYRLNGTTIIDQKDQASVNASAGIELITQRQFQQWDYVEVIWTQNSGGSVNVLADERTHWSILARPTVIVAVPYVKVFDSKAQNTAGGTFTSGADQTRVLTTIDSDTAGIASLASNQVTLPYGTYRYKISAPGYQCGAHQVFLYNVTDTVEIKRGTSETSGVSSATTTRSYIEGKVMLSGSKVLEVRHRCTTTSTTNGFGLQANFGAEIYTVLEVWKEG